MTSNLIKMSEDTLENLDNASLRKKCLEFGLPNVPITDTSRKLLIKRLRVAMTGEPADKKKNRRETIHVSKIPSSVDVPVVEEAPKRPPSRTNRRTIAATSVTSTVDDAILSGSTKPAEIVNRRRSVRAQVEENIPVSQKRKTAVVLEEDDEDEDDVILLEVAERGEREANEIILPRSRRSVSLSKTGVVTTSYSQETAATVPSTMNETESESDNDYVSKYVNTFEQLPRPLPQTQPTLFRLPERKVSVEPDRTLSFSKTVVNNTNIDPEPLYKPTLPPSRYSSLGSGYTANTASSTTSSSTTRRFTTGGYGATIASATKYTTAYADEEDEQDEEEETPYLSDFARRLERLKAEPLTKGIESPRSVPIKRDTQRYQSSIVGRRSTSQKESVADSFRNFLHALDHKYKLKRNFSIFFAVVLCLFIYIVFIH